MLRNCWRVAQGVMRRGECINKYMKNQLQMKFEFEGQVHQIPLGKSSNILSFIARFCSANNFGPALSQQIKHKIIQLLRKELSTCTHSLVEACLRESLRELQKELKNSMGSKTPQRKTNQTIKTNKQNIIKYKAGETSYYQRKHPRSELSSVPSLHSSLLESPLPSFLIPPSSPVCQAFSLLQEQLQKAEEPQPAEGQVQTKTSSASKSPVRLYEKSLLSKDKKKGLIKQILAERSQDIIRHCTFKPKINKNKSVQRASPTCLHLYQKGVQSLASKREKSRKRQQERLQDDQCTFKPALNRNSLQMIKRQRKSKSKSKERQKTGQLKYPFKPSLCPRSMQIIQGLPPFQERLQTYLKPKEEVQQQFRIVSPLAVSQMILEEKKKRIFQKVFDKADQAGLGYIGHSNFAVEEFPDELVELLLPMAVRIQQICREEWVEVMGQYYGGLDFTEKHIILSAEKSI